MVLALIYKLFPIGWERAANALTIKVRSQSVNRFCFFFDKKKVFGNDAKSRWDLTAAIPNFHTMATDGIRFDLVDQIPPFARFLPSYLADLEVMKWTFWTKIILTL